MGNTFCQIQQVQGSNYCFPKYTLSLRLRTTPQLSLKLVYCGFMIHQFCVGHFSGSTHCFRAIGVCCSTLSNFPLSPGASLGFGVWRDGSCPASGGLPLPSSAQSVAQGSGIQGCLKCSVQGRSWLRTVSQGATSPHRPLVSWPRQWECTGDSSLPDTRLFSAPGPSAELTGFFCDRDTRPFYQSHPRAAAGFLLPLPTL